MNSNKDPMEQIIVEDLLREAEAIDEELERAGVESMPDDLKEKIRGKLHEQIAEYEKERIYAQLSEEDKKALELGRKMLEDSNSKMPGEMVVYRRKRKRIFVVVAAVVVLVLAMGITSIGGAEKVIEMIGIMVGTREVLQVNTDEDNYIVTKDKEEEAYQEIKDVFGIDPVKPMYLPEGTVFVDAEVDENLQTATLMYDYRGEILRYYISSHYTESSWGIDVEDKIIDRYYVQHPEKGEIEVLEYETEPSKAKRYSSKYSHDSLEYFMIGTMEKEQFDLLVKNLGFF